MSTSSYSSDASGLGRVEQRAAEVARRVAELVAVVRRDALQIKARLEEVGVAARTVVAVQSPLLPRRDMRVGTLRSRLVANVRLLASVRRGPRIPVVIRWCAAIWLDRQSIVIERP